MTLTHRRIIYLTFMAIFIIVLPLIILHASGYRYNFKKKDLQKTGVIFLESKPDKVEVWFNNKLLDNQTPVRIKNLLPNSYKVKLVKEDYADWQKDIQVWQGQTSQIQYIRLFKNNQVPEILLTDQILDMVQNDNRDKLLLLKQVNGRYKLAVFNLDNYSQQDIFSPPVKIDFISFVDNDSRIALYTQNNLWLVDINSPNNAINLQQQVGTSLISNIKYSNNYAYYLKKQNLYQFNFLDKQEYQILAGSIVDYFIKDSYIYFLSNDSLNKTLLKKVNLAESRNPPVLCDLERSNDYQIVEVENNIITIHNQKNQELALWYEEEAEKEIIRDVSYFSWNNNQELLFGNDWELWSYRPQEEQDKYTLFTRLSDKIEQATWYPIQTHIFYLVDNKVKVTENLPSNRYTTDIIELEQISNLVINKKGNKIYFIAQIGNQQGLYELEIQ